MDERRIVVWAQRFPDRDNLVLQWHDPETGRRRSQSAKTSDPAAVEMARADLEYELNHGKHQRPSRLSWQRFREAFEREYVAGLRKNTQEGYRAMLDLFEELCGPTALRSITERTVSIFVAKMRQRPTRGRPGMMPSSVKVRLQFLHTAMSWAKDQKLLPEVPRFPIVKVPHKKPQPIPVESFERIFDKAPDDEMRAYLLCGWLAGLRLSEALTLEWEVNNLAASVDFAHDRIILPAEMVKATEDQWVPMDPVLRAALKKLPRTDQRVFHFTNRAGKLVSQSAISDRVAALAKQAGVKLTMHSLRKGFGCRYAGKVPAQVLQKLMRHANIKTTMEFYANIDDAVEEAVLGNARRNERSREKARKEERPFAYDANRYIEEVCGRL